MAEPTDSPNLQRFLSDAVVDQVSTSTSQKKNPQYQQAYRYPPMPLSPSRVAENDFQSNAQSAALYGRCPATDTGPSKPAHPEDNKGSDTSKPLQFLDSNSVVPSRFDKFFHPKDCRHRPEDFNPYPEHDLPPSWSNQSLRIYPSSSNEFPRSQSNSSMRFNFPPGEIDNTASTTALNYISGYSGLGSSHSIARHLSSTADTTLEYLRLQQSGRYLSGGSSSTTSFGDSFFNSDDDRGDWPRAPRDHQENSGSESEEPHAIEASGQGDTSCTSDCTGVSSTGSSATLASSTSSSVDICAHPESYVRQPLTRRTTRSSESIEQAPTSKPAILHQEHDVDPASGEDQEKNTPESDEPFIDPGDSSSDESFHVESPRAPKKRTKAPRKRVRPVKAPGAPKEKQAPPNKTPPEKKLKTGNQDEPLIDLGTPILDAHRGISLQALREKAYYFRQRNPTLGMDNRFLELFVGRLTPDGQLIDEFRCYVNGCLQINRRRDHILTHVSAIHLNERPFVCQHCGQGFSRKNECKRHEYGHSGKKPFVCTFCPDGKEGKSYTRKDLLRRHIARKHSKQ